MGIDLEIRESLVEILIVDRMSCFASVDLISGVTVTGKVILIFETPPIFVGISNVACDALV